jgi:galactokinase
MNGKDRLLHVLGKRSMPHLLTLLYGSRYPIESHLDRIFRLIHNHPIPGDEETGLFSTPGRTELAGNHTDHQGGKVIASAIHLDILAVATKVAEPVISIQSEGFPPITVDLDNLAIQEGEKGTTDAMVRGIAKGFVDRGYPIGGFIANTHSLVAPGSGLSSSAAFEILTATILNSFYHHERADAETLAEIAHDAEQQYYGKPSGLMDQIACACGGIGMINFSHRVQRTEIDCNFETTGYDLVIVHTGSNHVSHQEPYAAIPREMHAVSACFDREKLSEVPFGLFTDTIHSIRYTVQNDRALLRAFHFFMENDRVSAMHQALEAQDMKSYLHLVRESGKSSAQYVQNLYDTTEPTKQSIPLALALTELFLAGDGAYRVHGGGFAGTIQAYIPHARLEEYRTTMDNIFGEGATTVLSVRKLPSMRIDTFSSLH